MVENPSANAGDLGSIPGQEDSPGEGNANPLQYSCLGNPTDKEDWWTKKSMRLQESCKKNMS